MSWVYSQPVEIVFQTGGLSALDSLCEQRGFRQGVLVCDSFFVSSGHADKLIQASGGRVKAVYSDITPNPRTTEADACAALIKQTDADFAIALGGGSAMDCAKIACVLATCDEPVSTFHTGAKALPSSAIPLIAIPTTAGTGSEVTGVAVLTDTKRGTKAPLGGKSLFPRLALIDAELTVSLPPKVTASSGLDALSHALEGFWSRGHQPICDAAALHAARLVFDWLPRAFECGDDLLAREKMCEASLIAGLAFALPKTAASHAISFPLTTVYGLPHGEACAFTLDKLCVINADAEDGRLEPFAHQLGFSGAADMGERIHQMKKMMGMACTLSDAGIPQENLSELVKLSHHPNLENNPVKLDDDALMALFTSLI